VEDCLFCKIIRKELPSDIIHEDAHLAVFRDKFPKAPTHLLVTPKKHIINLWDLEKEDELLMGYLIQQLPSIAKKAGLSSFRTIINTGKESGQEIFHLHIHLLGGSAKLPGF
jgi:histidine triad (HIT) family protein